MKIHTCVLGVLVAGLIVGARAGTVSTDASGNITIDVAGEEVYTYESALPSSRVTVTKTGTGTVKFETAASGFNGTLAISEGFAEIATVDAGGRGTIAVSSGAAAIFSHLSTGQQETSVNAVLSIAGAGPDGGGALRYTGSEMGDQMFKKIILTADATMGGKRYGTLEMDMQNHVLTWVGTNLMSLSCAWKNFGGFVHNGTTDLCFQGGTFDASCTAEKTITINSGYVTFWSFNRPVPFKLVVNADSNLSGNWGAGLDRNTWAGPIEIAEGKTLELKTNGEDKSLRIAGKITGAGAVKISNTGPVYLDNESNDWTGGTSVAGRRFFPFSPKTLPGLADGRVRIEGSTDSENYIQVSPTAPIAGATVQHVWTKEEISDLQQSVARPASQFAGLAFNIPSGASYTHSDDIIHNVGLQSSGTLVLTGDFKTTDSVNASVNIRGPGRVVLDHADDATQPLRTFNVNSGGVLQVKKGDYELSDGMIRVGNGSRGAVWQESGTSVNQTSSDSPYFGESQNAYGVWLMDEADFTINGTLNLGKYRDAYGGLFQKGGLFKQRAGYVYVGFSGEAFYHVAGGTNDTRFVTNQGGMRFIIGQDKGGLSVVNVTGSNTLLRLDGMVLGNNDSPSTNVLNVSDGGEIEMSRFYKGCYTKTVADPAEPLPEGSWLNGTSAYIPYSNGCFSVVNANGGVFVPTFAWGWNHVGGYCPPRDPDKIVLYEKGLVVDTSRCMNGDFTAYANHSFPFHLDPATGKGFDAIYLPTNNAAFMAQTYIGPARVTITDATGWAATAFADFDKTTGKLTGVVVTSRGCDYSDAPTVTVSSADNNTNVFACTYTLSQNVCGGFTKRGAQQMELYNTNVYTGVTCVEEGKLQIVHSHALPSTLHCLVKQGSTLQLPEAMTLKSIGGAGTITGGAVTLTDGVLADPDALNARKGLTINNALTFVEGAKVSVSKLDEVESGVSVWPLVTATSAIVGTPTVDRTVLPPPYDIKFSNDRKTLYLVCPRGTTLILR